MTTWTTISNAAVAVGGIPSSSTVTALRDNPSALAESASGAPVVASTWHPYNKVSVGDGQTGLIYDFAVNGVQASVVTPDFEDGYEYRLIGVDLSHNSLSDKTLWVRLYLETAAVYDTTITLGNNSNAANFSVDVLINIPRISARTHTIPYIGVVNGSASNTSTAVVYNATAQKLLRAQVRFDTDSIDGGKIYFLRRREYITSP